MKKSAEIILGISVILAIIVIGLLSSPMPLFAPPKTVLINYTNIEKELPKLPLVTSLDRSAVVQLRFYNFNNGSRQWENSYVVRSTSVKKGTVAQPDVVVTMASKYLNNLTNINYCSVIRNADRHKDLGFAYWISRAKLFYKYRSMVRFANCL